MKHYHVISHLSIYLLSLVLFLFGLFHFMYPRDLFVYVPDFLIGMGGIKWAYVVGTMLIIASLSFAFNQGVKIVSYLLALLLLFFILAIHVPNYLDAGTLEGRQTAAINILKDTAIMAFSLHIGAAAHHQHFQFRNND